MITPITTAKELRVMLDSKAVSKAEGAAFLKARIDSKTAKGKFASTPTLNLYEELTGTHVMSKGEAKRAASDMKDKAKPAKAHADKQVESKVDFDEGEYRAKCESASLKQLQARLNKVHVEAKRTILMEVIATKQAPSNAPQEDETLKVLRAALASDDIELKNALLVTLISVVEK